MGEMFIAVEPRCPIHGKMFANSDRDRWECHGYDGEGCTHVITITWMPVSIETIRMKP